MEMINYSKEYFTKDEHDYSHIFDLIKVDGDAKIQSIKKELEKLQREVAKKEEVLLNEISEFQKTNYTPIDEKIIINYSGRAGNGMFDLFSGLPYVKNDEDKIVTYNVETKKGLIEVIVGYNFELGGIIVKRYSYTINQNGDMIKTKPIAESFVSFFESKRVEYNLETNEVEEIDRRLGNRHYEYNNVLQQKDKGFINGFFGVNYLGNKNLDSLINKYISNKSFEIILKTAPQNIIDDMLDYNVENAIPVYKIIGITKETYEKALEKGLILDWFKCKRLIEQLKNKSEKDILEFLEMVKSREDELSFYNISLSNSYYGYGNDVGTGALAETILIHYTGLRLINENYSLGKFTDYVLTETVNQGYKSVKGYIEELEDYLRMCEADKIVPALYSSYLKQTHDIASRNHAIKVEKESEDIFKGRYEGFKKVNVGKYVVVAPKCSDDLKHEGDNLNHCVGSYIKRVIDGKCLIYFLRLDEEQSLVTFEVVDNAIVQARGSHNRRPLDEEHEALKLFAEKQNMELKI